jgi:hypothetical protein
LTYHTTLQFKVYILMFFNIVMCMYNLPLQSILEYFHHLRKKLLAVSLVFQYYTSTFILPLNI